MTWMNGGENLQFSGERSGCRFVFRSDIFGWFHSAY